MSDDERSSLDERLELLFRQTGIDAHFAFVEGIGDLDRYAAEQFAALGVGSANDKRRGILLVYDWTSERLRIEVGYDLEQYFPDAFVGYLIHDNARYLFDAGDPAFALLLTIRMLEYRIRSASMGGHFDPAVVRALRGARHGSGGGGAVDRVPRARGEVESFARRMDPAWRQRFAAAESVEASYQRYVSWLAEGIFDPGVSLFTAESRQFLEGWPMTGAYFDYILMREYGNRVEVLELGDRAMAFSKSDPFSAPLFFRRGTEGWQLDLAAGVEEILNIAGGRYSWSFRSPQGPYASVYADHLVPVEGLLRLSGGDNRPAPVFQ